jgi:hypothetical protein
MAKNAQLCIKKVEKSPNLKKNVEKSPNLKKWRKTRSLRMWQRYLA